MPRISRAATEARTRVLAELKEDHKKVRKAYKEFQKVEDDPQACAPIVEQVLDDLTVHAALEEELLYPATHGRIDDESLVDEAEVEHESIHALIDQLRAMTPDDAKYTARFTVLCEYVLHHVKEEENEMFPQLEDVNTLQWERIAEQMTRRRQELTEGEAAAMEQGQPEPAHASHDEDGPPARGRRRGVIDDA